MKRLITRSVLASVTAALLALPTAALAEFPERPVTIVLPFGTGGVSDIAARLLSEQLEASLGQRFIVENAPGADGLTATQKALSAGNDGYTLLNMGNSATIRATVAPNLKPSQIDDFEPVAPVAEFGLVVVVAVDSPFQTITDLVEAAKADPDSVNIGTVAAGSTQNLTALLFNKVAGIDAMVVPYTSTPELIGAVSRGEMSAGFEIVAGALNPIKSGQVRLLATTMDRRSAVFPDVPTIEEAGIKPFNVSSWNSYVVPNGTPKEVIAKLNAEIQRIIQDPAVAEKMLSFGLEPFLGGPEAVDARLEADVAKWRGVIEAAGIPIEK